jgi:hypothetical protein
LNPAKMSSLKLMPRDALETPPRDMKNNLSNTSGWP